MISLDKSLETLAAWKMWRLVRGTQEWIRHDKNRNTYSLRFCNAITYEAGAGGTRYC